MAEYDLVVRNGTLATASDVYRADIGVIDGCIATIGAKLGAGRREINADGHIVTPGGIDSHCHIEQRSSMGVMTADDFFTTEQVTGQELPALIKDGYTSFKIYMTYDALKLDDRQILEVLSTARRERALVMVHAENHDVISWLSEKLLAAGHTAPRFHG